MKTIHDLPAVRLVHLAALLMFLPGVPVAADEPLAETVPGVVAEFWPLGKSAVPGASTAPHEFEQWRGQAAPAGGTTLTLDKLAIPAREMASLVRVRGVFIPPRTCHYAFRIIGPAAPKIARPDEAELWLEDAGGGWRLVQRTGNPNPRSGRIAMEQGVPRRFEFWTAGMREISVQWVAEDWDPTTKAQVVCVAREVVPASAMRGRTAQPDDTDGDGLRDAWKRKWRLDPASSEGPSGPWGDPDGDGLPNWQEQLAGTDPLAADAEGRAGLVRWEIWRDIPGQYVFDLTRSAVFPQGPQEVRHRDRLEIPPCNGDNFGSRLRGWIKAPASGEYTFMIIADDSAELWLGETESWQSKKMIARADQKGAAQLRWTRRTEDGDKPLFPGQMARVTLQKGQQYYVEVLHKQDTSQDHCAVAWVLPGTTDPEVIGAGALTSWKPSAADADDDGLPDAWQQAAGLTAEGVDPMMRDACADPDHDGLSNWEEWKAGSDPLRKDDTETEHRLSCQSWTACRGNQVRDLAHDARFPARPDFTTLVDNMDFSNEGDRYGVRLRGYLTAPEDGPYVFSISGNNACTLYLADSEDKFTKRAIAWISRGTGWRSYAWQPTQRSEPLVMKKGERRYIEVLFKRGEIQRDRPNQRDHSSVAWTRPGRDRSVIGAEFFSPYVKDARDLDDDDLPDQWERGHGLDAADPSGVNGAWGDPDGDWLENFREFQAGLDPQAADVHGTPGLALWECWDGIHGKLPEFKSNPAFPLNPTRREWLTSLEGPPGIGVWYGARLRALLAPPETGDYTFSIAGYKRCELYLSPSDSKDERQLVASLKLGSRSRMWEGHASQVSSPVRLEAGKRYYVEALLCHNDEQGKDHLSIAWKPPGTSTFQPIGGDTLIAFAGDPNDLDEDGLPDAWEKANGLDPTRPDGDLDPDGDGLTNREEYLFGTRPDRSDTDGDGVSDLDEISAFNSNPLLSDAIGEAVSSVALDSYASSSINWTMTSDGLLAGGFRGEATWNFTVPGDGNWLLRLNAELMGTRFGNEQLPMVVKVDGQVVGRRDVYFGVGRFGALQVLTQYLEEGTHQVSILVDNMLARRTVRLVSLKVYASANSAALLAQGNRMINHRAATRTSPLCVEGYARDAGQVTVNGKSAANGMGSGHWYANIPLEARDDLQSYAVQYEPGNGTTGTVTWAATNALAGETLAIRRGDSLRVGAWGADPAMASTLTAADGGSWPLKAGQTEVLTFPGAGVFTFRGVLRDGSAGTFTVHVFDAPAFPADTIDALEGTARTIVCSAADAVGFDTEGKLATLAVTRPDATSASLSLLPLTPNEFGIAARLGDGGPILDVLRVNVIGISDALQNSLTTQAASGIAGYKLYIAPLTVTNLPKGGRVDVSILRAGVMFPNGSTQRSVFPEDLVNGAVRLEFLFPVGMPGGYCHHLLVYGRDGEHLGTR